MTTYKIEIRVPLGKLDERIQEFDNSINQTMQEFGLEEKVTTTSVLPFVLTVPDDTSDKDLEKCKQVVLDGMKEHFGFAKIESFTMVS